ncbi:molybdate ABC transporter substrate-binding protein [Lentibacillus cibarius]|uniref:Molybdate ABC transporter substrate-binding protein n=1 Tax=Lentibacillus cibarius TaxID=2583219 RepID=A0A549YGM2_9BACI|nr:molybdate ABC transporter substrate-binding protein [Lentibacillus cibarius]TRM11032.1 molybdate ABC transporter substrate-binding protein [Lentibacillus cibarius]
MRYLSLIFLTTTLIITSGCTSQDDTDKTKVLISASVSLSDVMAELRDTFEEKHPDIALSLHYGASDKLAKQISKGDPVDVFLSVGEKSIVQLREQDLLATKTRTFATNRLILASNKQQPFSLSSLHQLPELDTKQIAIGSPESIPAGRYAKQALKSSGVWDATKNKLVHTDVGGQTLSYIESGKIDIGFVYRSDFKRSEFISDVLAIDEDLHDPITYSAIVTTSSNVKEKAKAFLSFLQTDTARSILKKYGFET